MCIFFKLIRLLYELGLLPIELPGIFLLVIDFIMLWSAAFTVIESAGYAFAKFLDAKPPKLE